MLKHLLLIVICVLTTQFIFAQQEIEYIDIVKIKNQKSKLEGKIISWDFEHNMEFRTKAGLDISIPSNIIENVTQKPKHQNPKYRFSENGLFGHVMFNYVAPDSENEQGIDGGLHLIGGYRLSRLAGVGIGFGYDNFSYLEPPTIFPGYLYFESFLTAKRLSPFWSLGVGYVMSFGYQDSDNWSYKYKGGLYLEPKLGWRLGGSDLANLTIGLSHKWINYKRVFDQIGYKEEQDVWLKRLNLSLGIVF